MSMLPRELRSNSPIMSPYVALLAPIGANRELVKNHIKRKWIENLEGWQGLKYIILLGVPMKRAKNDIDEIDVDHDKLTKLVAHKIIQSQVPITGKELEILRAATKLSYNNFARKLGLSYGAIFNWEKNKSARLLPLYEVAVRLVCAEELNVKVSAVYSELIGYDNIDRLEVRITDKQPTSKFVKTKTVYKPSYRGFKKVTVIDNSENQE